MCFQIQFNRIDFILYSRRERIATAFDSTLDVIYGNENHFANTHRMRREQFEVRMLDDSVRVHFHIRQNTRHGCTTMQTL